MKWVHLTGNALEEDKSTRNVKPRKAIGKMEKTVYSRWSLSRAIAHTACAFPSQGSTITNDMIISLKWKLESNNGSSHLIIYKALYRQYIAQWCHSNHDDQIIAGREPIEASDAKILRFRLHTRAAPTQRSEKLDCVGVTTKQVPSLAVLKGYLIRTLKSLTKVSLISMHMIWYHKVLSVFFIADYTE